MSAPVATIHATSFSCASIASANASTAEPSLAWMVGVGSRSVPSRPDSPWMAGAWTDGLASPLLTPR